MIFMKRRSPPGGRLVVREHPAIVDRSANDRVQGLDGVGGVDHPADVIRIIK